MKFHQNLSIWSHAIYMWMEAEGRFVQWLCNEPKTQMLLFPPDSGTNGRRVQRRSSEQ